MSPAIVSLIIALRPYAADLAEDIIAAIGRGVQSAAAQKNPSTLDVLTMSQALMAQAQNAAADKQAAILNTVSAALAAHAQSVAAQAA
jgi:hypothetical protein